MSTDLPAPEIPTDTEIPKPEVPLLSGNNLKLKDLGVVDLETYITYPGIKPGEAVAPNFRGCAADGSAVDLLAEKKIIDALDDQQRFRIDIPNGTLQLLSGGQVFYSFYKVENDIFTAQSLRHFFFVDRELAA